MKRRPLVIFQWTAHYYPLSIFVSGCLFFHLMIYRISLHIMENKPFITWLSNIFSLSVIGLRTLTLWGDSQYIIKAFFCFLYQFRFFSLMLVIFLKHLAMFGILFIFVDGGLDWTGRSLYPCQPVHVPTRWVLAPVIVRGTGGSTCSQVAFSFQCLLDMEFPVPRGNRAYLGHYPSSSGSCTFSGSFPQGTLLFTTRFRQAFLRGKPESASDKQSLVFLPFNKWSSWLPTAQSLPWLLLPSFLGDCPWFFWEISLLGKTLCLGYIGLSPSVL